MKHEFKKEITRPIYIRLNVKDSTTTLGLRFELYGCKRKLTLLILQILTKRGKRHGFFDLFC